MNAMKEFFASLMLRDLIKGLALTGRYLFARKFTIQFPEEKRHFPRVFVVCMHCVATQTVKSAVSPANCAKRSVRHWLLRLNRSSAMMVHVARHVTIST